MPRDRRVCTNHPGPARVLIDDVLFELHEGSHTRTCSCCDATIAPGEERYVPVRHDQRRVLVDGRHTRICVACVEARVQRPKEAAHAA